MTSITSASSFLTFRYSIDYAHKKLVELDGNSLSQSGAVARTIIGGGGHIFIYSCSALLISFEINCFYGM
jgi:hypothetical protein